MPQSEETIRETLRGHGLRSTPQRFAILNAFELDSGEHLSAEEIHARASSSLSTLSRATVYAALAELTELGLLSAVGLPEPVRYELNTARHDHFRCGHRRTRQRGRSRATVNTAHDLQLPRRHARD